MCTKIDTEQKCPQKSIEDISVHKNLLWTKVCTKSYRGQKCAQKITVEKSAPKIYRGQKCAQAKNLMRDMRILRQDR